MPASPSEIVRKHIAAALVHCDWVALDSTVTKGVAMNLAGLKRQDWTPATLYRHLAQAWDFTPDEVELCDIGEGKVRAEIRLTNGGGWVKRVEGEYHVDGSRIDAIALTDAPSVEAGDDMADR